MNVKQKHEFFGMAYNNTQQKLNYRDSSNSQSQEDKSDLNITYNSKLLDRSEGISNMTPEYGKNSSSNRESNDHTGGVESGQKSVSAAGVSRILSVQNLTEDQSHRHSSSELTTNSANNKLGEVLPGDMHNTD